MLKLSRFNVWPAYFILKSQEEMIFHISFLPDFYGVHVIVQNHSMLFNLFIDFNVLLLGGQSVHTLQ